MMKFSNPKATSKNAWRLFVTATLVISAVACSTFTKQTDDSQRDPSVSSSSPDARRGMLGTYDPGPPKDSKWPELFGSVPNYRAIGMLIKARQVAQKEDIGDDEKTGEKFRWMMGPMWYRGRLQPNQVKVFIVGQEGAQDENVSNRAFTGSTGTKVQNILNGVGIHDNYLFLNTFVYTINGQRNLMSPTYMWMEQDPESPIVQYRHKLFDYMAETNKDSVALFVGVGGGGKASLVTWVRHHGGKCSAKGDISYCDADALAKKFGIKSKILVVGIPHPGAAAGQNGGADAVGMLKANLSKAGQRIIDFAQKNPGWLPADTYVDGNGKTQTMAKATGKYNWYKDAPVPYMDFAFGSSWRLGDDGTASNRSGADQIQVFSRDGSYDDNKIKGEYIYKPTKPVDLVENKSNPIPEMGPTDLPWEAPRFDAKHPEIVTSYDHGPCGNTSYSCEMSSILYGQGNNKWPNFNSLGVTENWSFGHGQIYRGRPMDAKIIVLADQYGYDDLFSGRALTGHAGQRLQTFLDASGVGSSYVVIRTLPVDTMDLDKQARAGVITNSQVAAVRNEILNAIVKEGHTKAIVTMGEFAEEAVKQFNSSLPVVNLSSPVNESGVVNKGHEAGWNAALKQLAKHTGTDASTYSGKLTNIPRMDLPVHTRWWMGTSGDRAMRPALKSLGGKPSPDHYRVTAPYWVTRLKPVNYSGKKMSFMSSLESDGPTED